MSTGCIGQVKKHHDQQIIDILLLDNLSQVHVDNVAWDCFLINILVQLLSLTMADCIGLRPLAVLNGFSQRSDTFLDPQRALLSAMQAGLAVCYMSSLPRRCLNRTRGFPA